MSESLRVPGRTLPTSTIASDTPPAVIVKPKHLIAVQPTVRASEDDYVVLSDLETGDLIELEFRGGVKQWISIDQFREDLRALNVGRGAGDSDILTVPSSFGGTGAARGQPETPLERLTAMTLDFAEDYLFDKAAEPIAKLAAKELIRRIENKLNASPALRWMEDPRTLGDIVSENSLPGSDPILVFLHGTASSTEGSFGDLAGTIEWDRMRTRFGKRIVALEHNTLSVSPIHNAIEAAKSLPDGAILNIVSHSRGGLVGELLCIADLTRSQLAQFGRDRASDRDELDTLSQILRTKRFEIQRFVRVACPSRGTILASKRADRYLSVLLNLFGFLPIFQGNPFYKFMGALLKKVIALKADPNEIPGLEAQMPDSPLIHLLNRPDLHTKADLAIIAGDAHGGGMFQALGTFALDIFYWKAHDFVVNTDAMYGGIDRGAGGYYFDDRGPGVCHFHYFRNARTRERINAWLEAGSPRDASDFKKLAWRDRNLIFPGLRGDASLPSLVFVPGLFGTHLEESGTTVWLDWKSLLPDSLDRLKMECTVQPGEVIANQSLNFLTALNTSFKVITFPYDWRKPLAENARYLAEKLEKLLDGGSLPVHLLGLSSGGVVIQTMMAGNPGVWKQIRDRKGRAVVLGLPAQAARSAQSIIAGKHKLVRLLTLLDRRPSTEIGHILEAMPGVRELADWKTGEIAGGLYHIGARLDERDKAPDHTWFIDTEPENLTSFPFLADAIREVLHSGTSDRLDAAARPSVTLRPEVPVLYPTEQDLADAAFEAEPVAITEPIRIQAFVTHGHLRDASYPVAVGHYLGDGIVSAEKVLDQQLDGRLSQNFYLDLYPGAESTAEVIESPDASPPGAQVIGLGEVGGIKAEKVRRGITAAAVRYALSHARRAQPQEDCILLGITSLLLGTYGGNALTVRESIEAVVDGVAQANIALRTQQLWNRVRIENLEFIELYEDLAIQAAHELLELEARRIRESDPSIHLNARRQLTVKSGGLFHRPASPYQSGWWRRVSVREVKRGLEFTILTDRARADLAIQPTQRKLLAHCVEQAVSSVHFEEDLSRILFDLLLTAGLKDQVRDRTNLVFIVDRSTAYYPWEMLALHDRERVEPVASRLGLIRQLRTSEPPRLRTSHRNLATVVGVPAISGSSWPNLPNAQREAGDVADLLEKARYKVTRVTGEQAVPRAILASVLAENRILHLAGHGFYDAKSPQDSGFVIGNGLYLTAAEIGKIEPIPELVFLNCCYGGKIPHDLPGGGSPHRLAATISEMLITMGVKAIVASGWAVDDEAARRFALEFYDAMLNGAKFGEAVLRARSVVFRIYPATNTWGAYQCYGNPDFALEWNPGSREAEPVCPSFVARQEVLESVKSLQSSAVDVDEATRAELLQRLSIIDRFAEGKYDDGEVLSEVALAYAALGDVASAREAYEKAFSDPNSRVPVQAAEQLTNLLYREAEEAPEHHHELFEKALKYIDWALELRVTVERLAFKGSLYKRKANWLYKTHASTEQVRAALATALNHYLKACILGKSPEEVSLALAGKDDAEFASYPALNALAIEFLLGELSMKNKDMIDRVAERAAHEADTNSDFWHRAGVVDAGLLRELIKSGIQERTVQDELVRQYARTFSFGTRRQIGSVVSQMRFLRDMTAWMGNLEVSGGLNTLISVLESNET